MKKTLLIISILILGLITSCFIGIIVYHNKYCRDREDRAVADTIPRYPEASSWKIGDSTNQCLADGTPSTQTESSKKYLLSIKKNYQNMVGFWFLPLLNHLTVTMAQVIRFGKPPLQVLMIIGKNPTVTPPLDLHWVQLQAELGII